MAEWWEAAPLVQKNTGNWWEAAPLAKPPMAKPPEGAVTHWGDGRTTVEGRPDLTINRKGKGPDREMIMLEAQRRRMEGGTTEDLVQRLTPFGQGATFSFGDEAMAGIAAPINAMRTGNSTRQEFEIGMERQQQALEAERAARPIQSAIGEMAGSLVPGIGLLKAGASLGARAAQSGFGGLAGIAGGGAIDGAILGGISGAGAGTDDRGRNALVGAGIGGIAGAAAPLALSAASKVAGAFNKAPRIPSIDELRAQSSAAYDAAEKAGVIYTPQAMQRLQTAAQNRLANFGYHPANQPGAEVAIGEIDRIANGNVTLKGLDVARKVISGGYRPGNKSNNSLVAGLIDDLDGVVASPAAGDVLTGNAAGAASSLENARSLYARSAKADRVEGLLDRAGIRAARMGSGGNVDNTTRQEISKLLLDPRMSRGMTPDETAAAKVVVEGTPGQNLLRLAGKLSPEGNGLMAALQAGAAGASSGASIPLAVAGALAKRGADKLTKNNADRLMNIILAGGNASAITPAPNAAQRLLKSDETRSALIAALVNSPVATPFRR